MTLAEALAWARERIDAADARILLREASGLSAATIIAWPERELDVAAQLRYADWVERRTDGEPVAYILGWREFYGRRFAVSPATLIPRPDTELLVERAIAAIAAIAGPRILDLGTGTGAVAISLALELPGAKCTAVDASEGALAIAGHNAETLGATVCMLHGDWFGPVAGELFHCIVSNPPYIADADPHLAQGDLRFEPNAALASGSDGLRDIRRIVADAPAHLEPDGSLLLEHGHDQAGPVRDLLVRHGFVDVQSWRDLAGIERVSGGCWPARV